MYKDVFLIPLIHLILLISSSGTYVCVRFAIRLRLKKKMVQYLHIRANRKVTRINQWFTTPGYREFIDEIDTQFAIYRVLIFPASRDNPHCIQGNHLCISSPCEIFINDRTSIQVGVEGIDLHRSRFVPLGSRSLVSSRQERLARSFRISPKSGLIDRFHYLSLVQTVFNLHGMSCLC